MLRNEAFLTTDVSEERIASIIGVDKNLQAMNISST
jgi:hypothetical protein